MREVITRQILENLYTVEKKTDAEIAELLCVDPAAVTVARKRHGIKVVREWERKNLPLLTDEQFALLDGSILGDGCIEKVHSRSCMLSFGHSPLQHRYAGLKAGMLGEYLSSVRVRKDGMMRVRSIVHPVFEWYYEECYVTHNGKRAKRIPQFILDRLNPLSLAIWYCDDGSKSRDQVWFCIGCPVEEERQNAMDLLRSRFGLECSINKMTNEECWRLYVWKHSQQKFFDTVGEFVNIAVPYKIPEKYRMRYANQQPSLVGNDKEGSETMDEANGLFAHAGNVQPVFGNDMGTPGTFTSEDIVRTVATL
jgi:hypothetical protein